MVRTIKLDGVNNYFINASTNNIMLNKEFDPNNKNMDLIIKLGDSITTIKHDEIINEFGGQLVIQLNPKDKLIIDDGYRDVLIKAGYLVYKDYDEKIENNRTVGTALRDDVVNSARVALEEMFRDDNSFTSTTHGKDTVGLIRAGAFRYTISIDTINTIVNKNKSRKDNNLPFYPFSKDMDMYGTLYVSIFAKKKYTTAEVQDMSIIKYNKADDIIRRFVNQLGPDYHWVGQQIKSNKVLNYKGL